MAVTPTEVAALDVTTTDDDFVPLPIRRPGEAASGRTEPVATGSDMLGMRKLPSSTPTPASWIETAALAPEDQALSGGRLAEAFAPVPKPRKGARPSADDAGKGQISTRTTAPKLTDKIIAGWALDRAGDTEKASVPAKVRGERFVADQLKVAPKEVYAAGFVPDGGSQPHNKFSGSAVHFIQVARFGPAS